MSLLERSLPNASALPRVKLGDWPTPVTKLEQLGHRLGCEIWVKHDDRSATPYGGNKVRKLELLLADARRRNAHTLVTLGGFGSSHLVATAAYGSRMGFATRGVVAPQPPSDIARTNALLAASFGARLDPCPSRTRIPLQLVRTLADSDSPYLIGPGGSSPLGTLGYVFAALELSDQLLNHELPLPQQIFVPLGSGGTAAGLAIGLSLAGIRSRVMAVRVVERPLCNAVLLGHLVRRAVHLLRKLGERVPAVASCTIVESQAGACYGHVTRQARKAIELLAETEGLALEPTYGAKAMAALIDAVGRNPGRHRSVLFWHTANSWDVEPLRAPDAPARLPPVIRRWLESGPRGGVI